MHRVLRQEGVVGRITVEASALCILKTVMVVRTEAEALKRATMVFSHISDNPSIIIMSLEPASSIEARAELPRAVCTISRILNVDEIIKSVGSDDHGANVFFVGTTRNTFQGKNVTRLEYQAYSKLAIKTMVDIVKAAQLSGPQIVDGSEVGSSLRCAVHHRIGVVPVGEPSIGIPIVL
ncbi:hypothetical protein MPER_09739 [Moniliophthora perniciosa FA553]|nr:hypothetical protein MPER_09739 [Moniliophthora perniciosa FA553]